ncbi:hypothetical protein [Promineifilum sp.]|uniref:hypothetical protein n=1 Tax=Promineifilum sp. TaxID=2664178 RepID=UPI0035B49750
MAEPREVQEALDQLSSLAPHEAEAPRPPAVALARLKQQIAPPPGGQIQRSLFIMSTRRLVTVGLTLVLIVAALVAFPSVRAAANDFLGLFRVQKFAPISVSPQQLALLERLGEEGLEPGEFVVTQELGEPQVVDSPEAAATTAGFAPKTLNRAELIRTYVMDGGAGHLIVNLAGARAIVEAAGADPLLLPDSLDGARVDVTVYDSIGQLYDTGVVLIQSPIPDVNYPADVDPTVLGEALLQVLGTEPAEARRIAQSIDWTSTLLLPVPQDLGTYREANVNGVTGVVLEPFDPEAEAAVVWQQDGMVYMMRAGRLSVDELLAQANTVR